jgi:hypothetical protein
MAGLGVERDLVVLLALHADRLAFVVVGARIPGAVPGHLVDDAAHVLVQGPEARGFVVVALVGRQVGEVEHGPAEVLRDPYAFRLAAAVVHVHGVVPVGKPDAWQSLWSPVVQGEVHGAQHVIPDGVFAVIPIRDLVIEVGHVAGLAQVRAHGQNQPQVIVREPLWPLGKLGGKAWASFAGEG